MIRPRMGVVKRLPKLMVVGDQRVVLLQLGDLGLRRSHKMINGLAVISFARQRKAAVLRMRVTSWGLCSRWLLTRQSAVTPSHLRVTARREGDEGP